jgi:hypothetical protein
LPDIPALAKTLSDLGGWAAFLALGISLGFAVVKGWLVPGRYFDREVARADKAELAAVKNAEVLERLTMSVEAVMKDRDRSRA